MNEITLAISTVPELPLLARGKVRDIYDLDDTLLIVATDRISCFDVVLPTPIPDKGRVLTHLSRFWFKQTESIVRNHYLTMDLEDAVGRWESIQPLKGRAMVVDGQWTPVPLATETAPNPFGGLNSIRKVGNGG